MVFAFKRNLGSKELVNDDAEGPEVAGVVALLRVDHLGRDVVLSADKVLFLWRNWLNKGDFGRIVARIARFQ